MSPDVIFYFCFLGEKFINDASEELAVNLFRNIEENP